MKPEAYMVSYSMISDNAKKREKKKELLGPLPGLPGEPVHVREPEASASSALP